LILSGIFQGFYFIAGPLHGSMSLEIVSQEVMGRWIGLNRLVGSLSAALMAFVGGLIYDSLGPQYVFLIFVALDLLIRFPLLISMPETLHYQLPDQINRHTKGSGA
jgi:MFS family permease